MGRGTTHAFVGTLVVGMLLAGLPVVGLVGCGGGGGGGGGNKPDQSTLELTFDGLADLGASYVYEGWLIVGGDPVSTGRFTVNGSGVPSQTHFDVDETDAQGASAFVLTIEPATGDDPAPSDVHLLAGTISAGAARLTIGHASALGTDFADARGSYVLAAPTTVKTNGGLTDHDYFRGIWFLDPSGPSPSLTLPTLPSGWRYEGWVVKGGLPHSTGTFTDVANIDFDLAGPSAGTLPPPAFPGQDFVNGGILDLRGGSAAVTVEPFPDNAPEPFFLKPLVDPTIQDLGASVSQLLSNQAASNAPSGTLSIDGANVPAATTARVELSLTGLPDLGAAARYEGWLATLGTAKSVGTFDVDVTGQPSVVAFTVDEDDAANATEFILSIEPVPDLDSLPSATRILAGPLSGGTANLTVGDPSALGTPLLSATGVYVLATPTTPPVMSMDIDYRSGIWFMDPATGPGPGLGLPALPFGWRYEGWVSIGGVAFSTGRFDLPGGPDDDGPGPGPGPSPGAAFAFPGQDFIVGPSLVLPTGSAMVTVEPEPDNAPGPFVLTPLTDATIGDPGANTTQPMTNTAAATSPTGTATIK